MTAVVMGLRASRQTPSGCVCVCTCFVVRLHRYTAFSPWARSVALAPLHFHNNTCNDRNGHNTRTGTGNRAAASHSSACRNAWISTASREYSA